MLKKSIDVAVGVIINPQQEVLVSLRPVHVSQGGLWEFPGGKLEINENSYQALCRELKEEVNLTVVAAEPFVTFSHYSRDGMASSVSLHVWRVMQFKGEVKAMEGQSIRWVSLQELDKLVFPKANRLILEQLLS